ncbi:MAG TPA: lipid II flippase MurJ, partial [Flavitalea sp.]|nr:lipid II flippase MurJ [Flavitalea sp.]
MFKIESYKRGIVLSTVFNVFNKGLVFLNGIVVAYYFGASEGTDIFFYTYNTLIILGAFVMSMNSSVIIPESMRIRAEEGEKKSMQFLNFFIRFYGSILACGILLLLINPVAFFSLISNFKTEQLIQHEILLYLSLPLFALICLITLLVDIMTSYKFFTISMIIGIINGTCSIILVMGLHNIAGVKSVFYGFIISYVVNLLLLLFLLRKYIGWKFTIQKEKIQPRIWKNLGFAQIGNLASTLSLYTPMYILSGFNAGIITGLTFAQQIASLPNALITTQFSTVAGIKLNELYAAARTKDINKVFGETANFLHFILIPISCIMFLYAPEIVQLLLQLTRLDRSIGKYISLFMQYLGLILPFYVTNTLTSRLFMATHKIKAAFFYQLIFNIIQIICIYIAVNKFGIKGYPITLVLIYVSNTLIYYFVQKHFFNFINYVKVLKNLFLFILVNSIIAVLIFFGIHQLG